jgi:RHH-type proline utilization regulon transcriptional repressor/proline dehydrogenase/delta 1-pyrroline-5-carboxylate dehydrogenase
MARSSPFSDSGRIDGTLMVTRSISEERVREIGRDIFAWADAARPRVWQTGWWVERMTRWVDRDDALRTRLFQFVDCLPALQTDAAVMRHLAEYLDPAEVSAPATAEALLQPGPLQRFRESAVARLSRFGAERMAGRFIAGFDIPSVFKTIERLRREGMTFTLDVLGESTTSFRQADRYAQVYHDLIERLTPLARGWPAVPILDECAGGSQPRVNLSIKLTGLDPHCDAIDIDRAVGEIGSRLRPLFRHARRAGAYINIDMESTRHRRLTLEVFKRLLSEEEFRDWPHVGIALQAYLRDGQRDLDELLEWGKCRGHPFAIRLVKGAYWDAETAAAVRNFKEPAVWTNKWESDACYERMARVMLENAGRIRPAFASHNVRSLAVVMATAEGLGLTPRDYELQTLYGMGDPLKAALVRLGQCVRVYCPYGNLMKGMSYLIRRLLENTSNEGFLRQVFDDRGTHEQLLADPALVRPPSAPLPGRCYVNTDPEEPISMFRNASNRDFTKTENSQRMTGMIRYVRGELGREYPLIIGGEPVSTDVWFESRNPSRADEIVGKVALATASDADRAVAAARKAFPAWRATSAAERADRLRKAADRLEQRRFELAATMILESGKPWREADADVTEAVDHCRYYADQIERIEARPRLRNIPGEDNMLAYVPKGVCAVLSPWCFPAAILTGMVSAALAAGNTVVVKPARKGAITAAKLVEILHEAGVPPGAVVYLPGDGQVIGRHLAEHEDVNIVAFTGSAAAGIDVLRAGSAVRPRQSFIRKMIVEMGGKNAIIVDDDADLDGAVAAVIESAFGYAGQKCSSCSRLIVLDEIHEALCHRLGEAVQSAAIGPAEEPATLIGPVIDEQARERILQYIDLGRREGRLLAQGRLPDEFPGGYFVAPVVFVDVNPTARIAQEEILGPVLAVSRAADFEEAITIANGPRYALTGGVFSRSPSHIELARREFAVGNLYINRKITGSQVDAQPFGGYRLSGTGVKAGSPDYLLHFMDARCITENTQRSGLVPRPIPTGRMANSE